MRLACLMALLSTPLVAHAETVAEAPESEPVKTAPERPEVRLGGYIQPGFDVVRNTPNDPNDQDGFTFRNARITGDAKQSIAEDLDAIFKFNFDVAQGTFLVRDVFGGVHALDGNLRLFVGQLKVPLGLSELTSEALRQFGQPAATLRLGLGRDRGVRVDYAADLGGARLETKIGVFNGEGQNVTNNIDDTYLWTGWAEIAPLGKVSKGEPDLHNSPLRFAVGGSAAYTKHIARKDLGVGDTGAKELRYAAHAKLKARGFAFRAEYIGGQVEGDATGADFGRQGFSAQAGYVLPLGWATKLEPLVRFTQYDVNDGLDSYIEGPNGGLTYQVADNDERRETEFGLSAYFKEHALKINVMYRMTDFLEGPETDVDGNPLIGDSVFTYMQFGWL